MLFAVKLCYLRAGINNRTRSTGRADRMHTEWPQYGSEFLFLPYTCLVSYNFRWAVSSVCFAEWLTGFKGNH